MKELVDKLSAFSPDRRVLVDGYEGGFCDILAIKETHVAFNHNSKDWLGPHEEDLNSKDIAVVILRKSNS